MTAPCAGLFDTHSAAHSLSSRSQHSTSTAAGNMGSCHWLYGLYDVAAEHQHSAKQAEQKASHDHQTGQVQLFGDWDKVPFQSQTIDSYRGNAATLAYHTDQAYLVFAPRSVLPSPSCCIATFVWKAHQCNSMSSTGSGHCCSSRSSTLLSLHVSAKTPQHVLHSRVAVWHCTAS